MVSINSYNIQTKENCDLLVCEMLYHVNKTLVTINAKFTSKQCPLIQTTWHIKQFKMNSNIGTAILVASGYYNFNVDQCDNLLTCEREINLPIFINKRLYYELNYGKWLGWGFGWFTRSNTSVVPYDHFNTYICDLAAMHGDLQRLKSAHVSGCGWGANTTYYAAAMHHVECLKYAHQNGCPWDFPDDYSKFELWSYD